MTQADLDGQPSILEICTCDHVRELHNRDMECFWGSGTSMGCSCDTFSRGHAGRRKNCWCSGMARSDENVKAHATDVTGPEMVPAYVQDALDQVRADLVELGRSLDGYWKDQPDIGLRVENWLSNTFQHMEGILAAGR